MISEEEWNSIMESIQLEIGKRIGRRQDYFILAKVIKRDDKKNLVWVAELGDQPIPILAFDYQVKYHDNTTSGSTPAEGAALPMHSVVKKADVKVLCPKVGELVLIAREMGSDFYPRCLGVIHSRNWITDLEDT